MHEPALPGDKMIGFMTGFQYGPISSDRPLSVRWSSHATIRYYRCVMYRYVTGLIYRADTNQWVLLGDMPEFEVGQLLGGN